MLKNKEDEELFRNAIVTSNPPFKVDWSRLFVEVKFDDINHPNDIKIIEILKTFKVGQNREEVERKIPLKPYSKSETDIFGKASNWYSLHSGPPIDVNWKDEVLAFAMCGEVYLVGDENDKKKYWKRAGRTSRKKSNAPKK